MTHSLSIDLKQAVHSANVIIEIRAKLGAMRLNEVNSQDEVRSLTDLSLQLLEKASEPNSTKGWNVFVSGLRLLDNLVRCQTIARSGGGDLIAETARTKFLKQEFCSASDTAGLDPYTEKNDLINSILDDPNALRRRLLAIPLSSLYSAKETNQDRFHQHDQSELAPQLPLVRVIAFLDGSPIATPQLLRSELLYYVRFKIKGLHWPTWAKRLRLNLLTTCPESEYAISKFNADRPPFQENSGFEVEMSGQLKFRSGQSNLLDDLVFAVQVAFESDENERKEVPAIGHTQLRLKVTDENRQPLITGNRSLDRHISELATELISQSPASKDELTDLLPMLEALTHLLATYAQEAIYKGQTKVRESDFQNLVLRDLRNLLGQDVQEHVGQGGGFTDIRYRKVIVELKVESTKGDRDHLAKTYAPQATQYAGVEARQVSIVLVLDLTEKDQPPGDIRNDIRLFDIATHGHTNGNFPSKAFLFVINGNTRSPSSYST